MATLSGFDIVVLLLIGLGAAVGLARGFVVEVMSLLAWVAAIFAVRYFYAPAKVFAERLTGTEAGAAVLAFAVVFIVTFAVVRGIGQSIGKRTRNSAVGPLDRLLGLGFGGLKGLLAASVIFLLGSMVFDVLDPGRGRPSWLATSRTTPLVEVTTKTMVDFVDERRARADASRAATPPA